MSSPFQQKFSAKSPLNGNYYSGVDGLQYVSPKIPESKTPAEPSKKTKTPKTPEIPETTTAREEFKPVGMESVGITVPNELPTAKIPETPADVITNRKEINNKQTLERTVPGAKVEKIEKDKKKYLASFEPGFARDREGTTTIKEYIRKKEGKYKDKTLYQDQKQTGFTENGETTLGDWMNVGKEYEI